MPNVWLVLIRVYVVTLAIMFAYALYETVLKRVLYRKLGVLQTHRCLKIRYQRYKNSVLIETEPYGYHIFFDGEEAFVYGLPTGASCKNPYVPAYAVDLKTNQVLGFVCAQPIEDVKKFYSKIEAPMQTLFIREPAWDFDAWSVLNYMSALNIINISPEAISGGKGGK